MKTKKTAAIRAAELFKLVHGREPWAPLYLPLPSGWIKLGKMVLRLENKWTKQKRQQPA